MNATSPSGHPRWRIIVASFASYNVANLSLWLQPIVVAELIDARGFTSGQAGAVATGGMLTVALIMLLSSIWRGSVPYLGTALAGFGLVVLGGAVCLFATGFWTILGFFVIAAAGFALLMIVPSMALAALPQPAMLFGRMYSINLVLSSLLLFAVPGLGHALGRPPAFPAMLLFAAVMIVFIGLMPSRANSPRRVSDGDGAPAVDANRKAIYWLAFGVAAIGLAYGQVWAFFVVLGTKAGMTAEQAGSASGASLIGALVGSLVAGRVSAVIGKERLLTLSVVGISIALSVMVKANGSSVFLTAGIAGMFFIYLFFPTVLGAAAGYDTSGRGIALINGSLALLAAAGPVIAGMLIGSVGSSALLVIAIVAPTATLFAFYAAWRSVPSIGQHQPPSA